MKAEHSLRPDDFSLVSGGLIYRLVHRAGLIEEGNPSVVRRVIFFSLLTWLPVLILAFFDGVAFGSKVRITFLSDFVAHTRSLITIPLLIAAEVVIDSRIRSYTRYFVSSGIVPETELPGFKSAVAEATELRDLSIVDVLLLGLAYTAIWFQAQNILSGNGSTWHALASASGMKITLAGWWFALVTIPIFQFLCYRWLWRLIVWTRFLWRVAGLNLRLAPAHSDLAAGLGFLGIFPATFGIIPFALGTILSAILGRDIIFFGKSLFQFKAEIFGFLLMSLMINFGPLLVFTRKLVAAKKRGVLDYGAVAHHYCQLFDQKWVRGDNPAGGSILGSGDIQSLADIGTSYERVHNMRMVPFDPWAVVLLTASAIIPLLPLLLTVYPWDVLIVKAFQMLI